MHIEFTPLEVTSFELHDGRADLARSVELLALAAELTLTAPLVRLYRPPPTMAFTRRESRLEGFQLAAAASERAGFAAVIRPTGGRVVAYDDTCLLIDLIEAPTHPRDDNAVSFGRMATAITEVLGDLGIDARVGAVPGEYCPGDYSVNARGTVKLVGISQRVSRGYRLVSAMVVVQPAAHLAAALVAVNHELGFDWRPETFGSVHRENPSLDFDTVLPAFRAKFAPPGCASVTFADLAAHRVPS